jgi:hypothetical protein
VQELEGLSPAERFRAIADGISALPTAAERSRAALQIFGKGAAELLPMFEGGAGAIASATDEAARFGLALTNDQAASVNSMSDSFAKAQMAVQGIVGQVVAYLAPAIQGVTDTFLNLIGGIGGASIGQFIGEGIIAGAQFLATVADLVISGLSGVWEFVSTVIEQFGGTVSVLRSVGFALEAVWYLGEAVYKGVGVIMANALAGYAALLDELPDTLVGSGWAEFGDSLEASASRLAREAEDAVGKSANSALNAVGLGDQQETVGAAIRGPLSTILADGLAKARADAEARSLAEPIKPPAVQAPLISTQELKGTDSRSKEGMAEMFRLIRGNGVDIAEQQLEEQRKTNELLSEGDDMEAFGILGA